MSKISKSIVISEFLWLLFFAVVFLKFDYTRTTLAVVNAIVWLCIVLVFSIIILQFLTRPKDFFCIEYNSLRQIVNSFFLTQIHQI
jgi:hypothetical protein